MLAENALVYYGEKQLPDELAAQRSKAVPPRSGSGCRPVSGEGQLLTTVPFRGRILDQLAERG